MSESERTLSSFELPYHPNVGNSLYLEFARDAADNIVEVGESNGTLGYLDSERLRMVAHDLRQAAEALESVARRRDGVPFDAYISNHTERLP